MKRIFLLAFCSIAFCNSSWAQAPDNNKCGYEFIHAAAVKHNPNFDAEHAAIRMEALKNASRFGAKTTISTPVTVPVIFHIVLDSDYLKLMDPTTIEDRVNSQIQVLNEDYNKGNADSAKIPTVFKTRYGNPGIHFALAHVDPKGNYTPGWEVVVTNKNGFELNNDDPGANAKYTDSGGADAWDVTKYINVWIVNFLVNGSPSTTIGLTIMPSWTGTAPGDYPKNEMGVMLRYDAWGRRSSSSEVFFTDIDQGRTLTHEMGHYFEMIHIWGDDGGAC
ncbi:MAG: M43 family zinc metalloprotease, partial [Flavipsychrobacter sp.]